MSTIFASFVIVRKANGFAATTRPDGRIGLPGGKLEEWEDAKSAAIRESEEEGWKITGHLSFHHTAMVDGKTVAWFTAKTAKKLKSYKEKARGIKPVITSGNALAKSGMGNEFLAN